MQKRKLGALAPIREQVVIATKFGFHFDADGKQAGGRDRRRLLEDPGERCPPA